MIRKIKLFILGALLTLSSGGVTNDSRDGFSSEEQGTLKRSYRQHPLIDTLLQSVNPKYEPKQPDDFFDFLRDQYPLPDGLKSPLSEYDYIIVGAGSAGCTLAARLTEDPKTTVLLLEAGKGEMFTTDAPAIAAFFQRTDYTWQYFMEKEPGVCLGMINKKCFWPRGKAIGGTSVINYMIYTRGRPEEWNRIAAAGNVGWTPMIDAFLEAGRERGIPTVDYNAPEQLGFGYVQSTTQDGKRVSAAKAFLHRNKNRPNLHILPNTRVTKVLIDSMTKTAYGVQYVRNRLKRNVAARKEVILSAGPIASPQLLMLSGVGPKDHLSSHGIPVIQDLPVGRTLYDHISFPGLIFTLNTTGMTLSESRFAQLPGVIQTVTQWLQYGDGPPASPGAVEGIGYIRTPVSNDPDPVPDMELISIGGSLVSDGGPGGSKAVRRGMMISEKIFDAAYGSIDDTDTWSPFLMLLHPESFGFIELKDNNPWSHPRMHGRYLSDAGGKDVATFVAAVRFVQELVATTPFQRFGARLHRAQYPACRALPFDSDAYWECAVRTLTATLHHQIATCRMGPAGDPQAVVDPRLRVHGLRNLRVVDSSIIPRTVAAHTNAPAIMIGEKAADMIKEDANR
ncbi:glucose dehydrogenase [FAD, quinone]-like isoform X2 [Choristoneura fumiferana]|uniref:glucose dehydrogenase [FAD, quinone]-like isoform X2 n=1 Tax=Choristoneura fumiferana TaxID=7141 RepID=UPI003D15E2C6